MDDWWLKLKGKRLVEEWGTPFTSEVSHWELCTTNDLEDLGTGRLAACIASSRLIPRYRAIWFVIAQLKDVTAIQEKKGMG